MIGTRPDIGYAVGKLSQYCEKPTKSHWSSVKRVLCYLKGTCNIGKPFKETPQSSPTVIVTLTGLGAVRPGSRLKVWCSYLQGERCIGARRSNQSWPHRLVKPSFVKYPHLAPPEWHARRRRNKALLSQEVPHQQSDEPDVVCLLGVETDINTPEPEICLGATNTEGFLSAGSRDWVIDSGSSSHLTYDRAAFTT